MLVGSKRNSVVIGWTLSTSNLHVHLPIFAPDTHSVSRKMSSVDQLADDIQSFKMMLFITVHSLLDLQ